MEDKPSRFSVRSVIVTNGLCLWDQNDRVLVDGVDWFIHAERRKKSEKSDKYVRDEPASYTDEDLAEIEATYDAEYRRGADTLFFEDVDVGTELPRMVKGPLTVTDLINCTWVPDGSSTAIGPIGLPTKIVEQSCAASTAATNTTPGTRCSGFIGTRSWRRRSVSE
ncbi:hypothetical protein AB5I41_14730 [Sphingomonas sp. MMS24-JH45]